MSNTANAYMCLSALSALAACSHQATDSAADAALAGDAGDGGSVPSCSEPVWTAPDPGTCDVTPTTAPPQVATDRGPVHGSLLASDNVYAYLGVPYAAPPIGDFRLRPPQLHACWTDAIEVQSYGSACPQIQPGSTPSDGTYVGDEDCLTLNVWSPAGASAAAPQPVMVWIHGGGHHGGTADANYDGAYMANRGNVVVVSINYRLGALGYLAHACLSAEDSHGSSGNYGNLDTIAALQWVHRNIAQFGGDAQNVTVFGESAGGENTCVIATSPLATGLYQRTIIQSASRECEVNPLATEELQGEQIVSAVGCDGAADVPTCLRSLPAKTLITQAPGADSPILTPTVNNVPAFQFGPNIDGYLETQTPAAAFAVGAQNPGNMMIGTNHDEGVSFLGSAAVSDQASYAAEVTKLFGASATEAILAQYPSSAYDNSPEQALVAAFTDAVFTCPTRRIARGVAGVGTPVYRYWFTHAPSYSPFGPYVYHGADVAFVFHNTALGMTANEQKLSDAMIDLWTRFATTDDPNASDPAIAWPSYDVATDPYLDIDIPPSAGSGIRTASCDFWDATAL